MESNRVIKASVNDLVFATAQCAGFWPVSAVRELSRLLQTCTGRQLTWPLCDNMQAIVVRDSLSSQPRGGDEDVPPANAACVKFFGSPDGAQVGHGPYMADWAFGFIYSC